MCGKIESLLASKEWWIGG